MQSSRNSTQLLQALRGRIAAARSNGRASGDRGGAVVETALMFPLFITMLLGIGSSSVAYGQSSAIDNATREAARYGATLPVEGGLSAWLIDVVAVAEAASTGDLDLTREGHSVCVAYVHPDGVDSDDSTLSRRVSSTMTVEAPTDCFSDGRPASDRRVQVVIERPASIEAAFFSTDLTLSAEAAARFERGS